jgi:hypothetical protein
MKPVARSKTAPASVSASKPSVSKTSNSTSYAAVAKKSNLKPFVKPNIANIEPTEEERIEIEEEWGRNPNKPKAYEVLKDSKTKLIGEAQASKLIKRGDYQKAQTTYAKIAATPKPVYNSTGKPAIIVKQVKFKYTLDGKEGDGNLVTEEELREYYSSISNAANQPNKLTAYQQMEQFDNLIQVGKSPTGEDQRVCEYLVDIIANKFVTGNLLLTSDNFPTKIETFQKSFTTSNVVWGNNPFSQRVINFLKRIQSPVGISYYDVLLNRIREVASQCFVCGDQCGPQCRWRGFKNTLHGLTGLGGRTKRRRTRHNKQSSRKSKRRTLRKHLVRKYLAR